MLMPKKDRHAIFEYLFKEGVLVAKKDFFATKHPQIPVPNLHVIKAMQSLVSRGFAKEQFAWRHYYWSLTNEGITFLREFLHLPPEIVPATLKRATRDVRGTGGDRRAGPQGEREESDRDAYRRGDVDKVGEAGVGAGGLEFKSGFGRGKPM